MEGNGGQAPGNQSGTGHGWQNAQPGWYPAPGGRGHLQWWNGSGWTAYYRPAPYLSGGRAARPPLPSGAAVYSWAIWAVTLLPFAAVLLELALSPTPRYGYIYRGGQRVLTVDPDSVSQPAFLIAFAAVFVAIILAYGLSVWSAYLDWKKLNASGVVRPFHWAWAALSPSIYTIGRSVIAYAVAKPRGLAPVWVLVATFIAFFVLGGIKMLIMFSSMAGSMTTPLIGA